DHALGVYLLLEFGVFAAEPVGVQGILDQNKSLFQRERLFEKIKSAQLGCAHSGFDGAMSGDHDYLWTIFDLLDALQRVQPIHSGQPDIEQNDLRSPLLELLQAGFTTLRQEDTVSFILEDPAQRLADIALIINNQNGEHKEAISNWKLAISKTNRKTNRKTFITAKDAKDAKNWGVRNRKITLPPQLAGSLIGRS